MGILWKENGTFKEEGMEKAESLWIQSQYRNGSGENDSNNKAIRPSLKGEISTEVAVIGGGIAGVLIAYLLQQRGVPAVILECRKAGGGITKNTTAKITSQHSLIYKKLISYKGEQRAWEYAMVISDMISGKENEYRKVFTPRRLMLSGSRVLLKDAAIITISLLSEHLKIPHDRLKDIEKGKAGIVRHDGQRVGVYRDKDDKYYFVTTKCPHLGCKLEWNQNEMTWDCPCHGSRFDYHGKMIDNPAMRNVFDACIKKRSK